MGGRLARSILVAAAIVLILASANGALARPRVPSSTASAAAPLAVQEPARDDMTGRRWV